MLAPDTDIKRWTVKEISALCEVSLKTAKRWRDGTICPPRTAMVILTGDLSYVSPAWKGWFIRGDYILSPDQWKIRRNDALAVPLMHGQISQLRTDLRRAKKQIEHLEARGYGEDQPSPDSIEIPRMALIG